MVDIHCHALFGVDDGPEELQESLEMLHTARKNLIMDLVLTPHYRKSFFSYPHDKIEENFEILLKYAGKYAIKLHPGCEYHVDHDIVDNFRSGRCMTLAGSSYVLAEFSTQSLINEIRSGVDQLLLAGYKPVIAHAERYEVFRRHPEYLGDFRKSGAMIQVNAGNILGEEGSRIKNACQRFLKDGNVDVVASDAHNLTGRRCRMKECRDLIEKKYGRDTARTLFNTNPKRIIDNE